MGLLKLKKSQIEEKGAYEAQNEGPLNFVFAQETQKVPRGYETLNPGPYVSGIWASFTWFGGLILDMSQFSLLSQVLKKNSKVAQSASFSEV